MSAIITHIDNRLQLTIHRIEGAVTDEDLITTIVEYNRGEPTTNIIWDFSAADLSGFQEEHVHAIIKFGKTYSKSHMGGKSALVLPDDTQFSLGRMAEAYAELLGLDFPVKSFRSIADAKQWMDIIESF